MIYTLSLPSSSRGPTSYPLPLRGRRVGQKPSLELLEMEDDRTARVSSSFYEEPFSSLQEAELVEGAHP